MTPADSTAPGMIETSAVGSCSGELLAGVGGRLLRFLQLSLGTSYPIVALSRRRSHPRRSLDYLLGAEDTTVISHSGHRAVEKLGD